MHDDFPKGGQGRAPTPLPSPFSPRDDAALSPRSGPSAMPDTRNLRDTLSPTTSSHSTSSATSTSTPDAIQYLWNPTAPQEMAPSATSFPPATSLFMSAAPAFMPATLPFMAPGAFIPTTSHAMLPTCWPEDLLLGPSPHGYNPPVPAPLVPDSLFYPTGQLNRSIFNAALLPTPEDYTYNTALHPTLSQLYSNPPLSASNPPSPPRMTTAFALPVTTAVTQALSIDPFTAQQQQQLQGSFMLPTSAALAGPTGTLQGVSMPRPTLRRRSPTTPPTSPLGSSPPTGVTKAKVVLHSGGQFQKVMGRWVYKGGETRLVAVQPSGSFQDLLQDLDKGTTSPFDQGWQLKYELPGSPEVLVDIIDDDDVQNMWDEWQCHALLTGVKPRARSNKLRVYIQTPAVGN